MSKRILSVILLICMLLNSLPAAAFAEETTSGCSHVCDEICGFAEEVACDKDCPAGEAHVEGCAYQPGSECAHQHNGQCGVACTHAYAEGVCAICGETEPQPQPCEHSGGEATCEVLAVCELCKESYGDLADHVYEEGKCACGAECTHNYVEGVCTVCNMAESKPVCNCGTDDASIHATTCAVYAAPEKPECHCVEKCLEANIWCDVCGIDYSLCGGTGKAEAYTDHKHCLSVHEDCTGHEDAVTWTAWEKTDSLPTSGNYYLTADVTLSNQYTVSSTLNLCLNGHTIKPSGSGFGAIKITGDLSLTDCKGNGKITGFTNNAAKGGAVYSEGTFTMYGGIISGNTVINKYYNDGMGGGVYSSGTFTMHGGTISDNVASFFGGGVYSDGTFTMSGGTISGNEVTTTGNMANYGGGGVYSDGTFTMSGGTIKNNKANTMGGGVCISNIPNSTATSSFAMSGGKIIDNEAPQGGGVYIDSRKEFTMSGGTISGNTSSSYGGGVRVNGTFTMSNGTIRDNKASNYGGGVYISSTSASFTMTGGNITGNAATNNGGGVYMPVGAKAFNLSGSPIISGNTGGNCYIENKGDYFITVTDALSDNARIGITTWDQASFRPFCRPASSIDDFSNYKNWFFSDIIDHDILQNSDGSLYTKQIPTYALTFDSEKAKVTVRGIETQKAVEGNNVVISPIVPEGATVESVTATGCTVTDHGDGTYSFTMPANVVTITVTFNSSTVEEYDVWVGGEQFTSEKLTINGTSGTATYNPETCTLTLNGFSYTGQGYVYNSPWCAAIFSKNDLTVKVVGSNTVTASVTGDYTAEALNVWGALTITGDSGSSLTLTGAGRDGVGCGGNLKIENVTVNATGTSGLYSDEGNITINNAEVTATATTKQMQYAAAIYAYEGNITIENSTVTAKAPYANAVYSYKSYLRYTIKNSNVTISAAKYGIGLTTGTMLFVENSTVEVTSDAGLAIVNIQNNFGAAPRFTGTHVVYAGADKASATEADASAEATYANKYVKIVPAYTITFASNGGSACDPIVVEAGSEVTSLPAPSNGDYIFGGWYTSEDLSGTAVESVKPTANMTLYAKWTVRQYTITFNTDGGTKIEDIVGASGTAVTAPADPTKTGYTFAGWDKEIPTTMPAENVTINAKWTANSYDAIFNADGGAWADGETTKTVSAAFGSVIVAPADPAKTGYIFAGWTPAVGNMDSVDGKAFTATWTINQYTVTFKVDGETVEAYTQTVNHGGDADMTKEIPHKVGYDDKSPIWSIDGVNAADGKNITADTEFSAVYFQNSPGTYEDTTDSSGNAAAVEIETPIQDLMDAVPLTQEELQQVALGKDVKFWMVSVDGSSAISAEDKALVDKARSGDIVGMYLDIDLFKQIGDNNPVQVTSLDEKIAVTLNVPASLINSNNKKIRTYYVIRVHNGATTVINPTFDAANRTLTFKTDRFSTYAISYVDTTKPDIVKTGDESQMGLWMSIFAFSTTAMAVLLVLNKKKPGKYARK